MPVYISPHLVVSLFQHYVKEKLKLVSTLVGSVFSLNYTNLENK